MTSKLGSRSGLSSITHPRSQRSLGEVLKSTELTRLPEHSTRRAGKAKRAPRTRNHTRRATIKISPLKAVNVRIVTKPQNVAATEAGASQEAKDLIENATKTVVVGITPRMKGHISRVMQAGHNHHVDVVVQTTEAPTHTVNPQHHQETTELNPAVTKQAGVLDAEDRSVEEEEVQEGV